MTVFLYVGSVNRGVPYAKAANGKGISVFRVEPKAGAAELVSTVEDIDNPTFLAVSPDGRVLVSGTENAGATHGGLISYSIDKATGGLRKVTTVSSGGATPAHIAFDRTSKFVGVANYWDAPADTDAGVSLAVFPLAADGTIGAAVATPKHTGHGPSKARQDRPHAHCLRWSPDNRYVAMCDLGLDRVVLYRFDAASGKLERHGEGVLTPGAGPRHLVFHPDKPFVYVASELDNTVTSFAYDAEAGALRTIGIEPTLPSGAYQESWVSAIVLSPDGERLFVGNRGHDSVARFEIGKDGIARFIKTIPAGGQTPRDGAFDPTGTVLAVANQASDRASLFRYEGGNLAPLADIATGTPTALAFLP